METKIQKWGNSLAVRIPSSMAKESDLFEGAEVKIELDKNSNIILKRSKVSLKDLLSKITIDNHHEDTDISFGPPVGRELI